jgi:serine phosphatase RsbU (regulator of sigma subunit)
LKLKNKIVLILYFGSLFNLCASLPTLKIHSLVKEKESSIKTLHKTVPVYSTQNKNAQHSKKTILELEDTLKARLARLEDKKEEYVRLLKEIDKDRQTLYEQQKKITRQKKLLYRQDSRISTQRNVIVIIGILLLALFLLIYVVRANKQRKIANLLLTRKKIEIEKQKTLVDEKQKEILDSIKYAQRIQKALIANDKMMSDNLKDYFILFKPKDIVAGDFYWAAQLPDSFIYVTGDSTGHGVPGAFMSLLNITKLNEAVNQKNITRPDLILNSVRENIILALNPIGSVEESKDGMDAILCNIDLKNRVLQYAAANNNFCIIRKREIIPMRADKMPIGKSNDDTKPFTLNEVKLEKDDMIYTFTDGYGDQFGGPRGKKFKHRILREILVKISELPPAMQKNMLEKQLEDWKGHLEQVDDVLVIGVRVL